MRAFRTFDTDRNGKLSMDELKVVLGDFKVQGKTWELIIEEADKNKDGELDYEEFVDLLTNKI
jgi:calcium-dependent protein kinase